MTAYQTLRSVRKGTPVKEAVAPDPPAWEYDAKALGIDWSYHLVYGVTTALAFRLLEPRGSS